MTRYTLVKDPDIVVRMKPTDELLLAVPCDYCGMRRGVRCRTRKKTTRVASDGFTTRTKHWPASFHDARFLAARDFIERNTTVRRRVREEGGNVLRLAVGE